MNLFRLSKPGISVAVAMQLLFVAPLTSAQNADRAILKQKVTKSLAMDFLEQFKTMTLQWEGDKPVRVIRIPLISGQNIAASYIAGKIPFIGAGISKSSTLQIRKVISTADAERMSSPDWSPEKEIEQHLNKNPFTNENALFDLEPGEEIRFEMTGAKSVGLKMGAGLGPIPLGVGGSANS